MPEEESSEELIAVSGGSVAIRPIAKRTPRDYVALAIATCGVGYLPLAPGTWGSLVGVGFYFLLRLIVYGQFRSDTSMVWYYWAFIVAELTSIVVITLVGTWAASRTERISQTKDPGRVVIDEVAGQLIALLAVPLTVQGPWPLWLIPAFLLFRFFDIVKPYPARRLESLEGGLGIMADDLVAGAYAAIIVALMVALRWFV
jgi:phosphatidylglycerophosphatase A